MLKLDILFGVRTFFENVNELAFCMIKCDKSKKVIQTYIL